MNALAKHFMSQNLRRLKDDSGSSRDGNRFLAKTVPHCSQWRSGSAFLPGILIAPVADEDQSKRDSAVGGANAHRPEVGASLNDGGEEGGVGHAIIR